MEFEEEQKPPQPFEEIVGGERGGALCALLAEKGITMPTSIQEEAIPAILSGANVLASSETGSGKTLAYILPILTKIDLRIKNPQAVILTPTRELAAQVYRVTAELSKPLGILPALMIDGASLYRQIDGLKGKPRVIVGIAPRVNEILDTRKMSAHNIKTIITDEADRMLDPKNIEAVKSIIKKTLKDRQLAAFSASVNKRTADEFSRLTEGNFKRVAIEPKPAIPPNITHYKIFAEHRDKIKVLRKLTAVGEVGRAVVFLNSAYGVEEIASRLNYHGISAAALSGAIDNVERRMAIGAFISGQARFLICSDVAARGLDLPQVTHIVNYDAPRTTREYQHRAGRTGRMGAAGTVITIAEKSDARLIADCERTFGILINERKLAYGELRD